MRKRVPIAAAALVLVLTGCANEQALRQQQAKVLRRVCQSFRGLDSAASDQDDAAADRLDRFIVGGRGGIQHPMEAVARCR